MRVMSAHRRGCATRRRGRAACYIARTADSTETCAATGDRRCARFTQDRVIEARDGQPRRLHLPVHHGKSVIPDAALRSRREARRAGTRFGVYTIKALRGEGAMGRVYLPEQPRPVRREVALKLIREQVESP